MSKRKSKTNRGDQGNQSAQSKSAQSDPSERALVVSAAANSIAWPRSVRLIVSLAILCYLTVVLLGPLSNPIASQHFSAPIANAISPIHRAMFLGHGYRFFAPEPGPGHLLIYRGVRGDGSSFEGQFPDAENHWPRLLYHRWFMLSETIFNEQIRKPSAAAFELRSDEYDRQLAQLRLTNRHDFAEKLTHERSLEKKLFHRTRQRVDALTRAVAKTLLDRNDGTSIELFIQERQIPFPEDVSDGSRLNDERWLTELLKICELDGKGFRALEIEQSANPDSEPGQLPSPDQEEYAR